MRPDKVRSVLFVDSDVVKKSNFLFQVKDTKYWCFRLHLSSKSFSFKVFIFHYRNLQCAVHWAEQGTKVDYISSNPVNTLPPPIHGIDPAGPTSLRNIRFMYLPKRHDLLHHMYTLHEHTHIPEVMLVNGLEYYCGHEERPLEEKHESEMNTALVCASLLDATAVAAKRLGKTTFLVAHFQLDQHNKCKLQPLELFFSDMIWFIESSGQDSNKEIVLTTATPQLGYAQKTKIIFEPRSWDGALVLKKITHLIKAEQY